MYIMEQQRRPPRRPPPSFPTYDVKIIAGRRVVIFHQNKKDPEAEKILDNQQNDKEENNEENVEQIDDNADEETMLAIKASSVPSSRSNNRNKSSATSSGVPPHPNYHNGRRLSLSDSLNVKSFEEHSRYPVLPPLTKSREASQEDVDLRVQQSLYGVSERAFQVMLREMRKTDRDRDGVLRPEQIEAFMSKFKFPIEGVLSHLQNQFADNDRFVGMTNYEDLMKYLNKMWLRNAQEPKEQPQQLPPATENQSTSKQRQMSSKVSTFEDRGEARLILDLEAAISSSPNFNLDLFRSSLESKDMYGNEQVSKQHVIQAANNSKLAIPREVLGRWLVASDPINRGFYSIPKLVNFLERSQPNVIKRFKTAKLSKSHGNLSYGRGEPASVEFPPLVPSEKLPKNVELKSPRPQNLEDLSYLKQALVRSHQEVPGYLSADDVRHVCSSYSAAFQMNISPARIQEAITNARQVDPGTGMINIGLFCRFLDNAVTN